MRLSSFLLAPAASVLVASAAVAAVAVPDYSTPQQKNTSGGATVPDSYPPEQKEASKKIQTLQAEYNAKVFKALRGKKDGCTIEKLRYRKEWAQMCGKERIAYTNAVQCLQKTPSLTTREQVPGSRSYFDDFAATHFRESNYIHFSGFFLAWHRYFVYLYEEALRSKCGYQGVIPYWDWTLTYLDPASSAIFDGSSTSMGSNGAAAPIGNRTIKGLTNTTITFPTSGAGGCVHSGPFANHTIDLGPFAYDPEGPDNGLGYNPRCLKRDVSKRAANRTRPTDVTDLLFTNTSTFALFDQNLENPSGVHVNGHAIIGGDPGLDAWYNPAEPLWFLHHGQIDRLWTLWQSIDFAGRVEQTGLTGTIINKPPSPNVTLDSTVGFGYFEGLKPLREMVSATDGPFCYMYV